MTTTTFTLPSTSPSLSPTSASDADSDYDSLPYPAALPRSAFLATPFNPQTYLSTLRNRHQTLEDLRSELRQRSQLLNKELLDLLNGHYEEFLSLGAGLRGGEEKVEGVRVGVLGFGREVGGVRDQVGLRVGEVEALVTERKRVGKDVMFGRGLLELVERVEGLEDVLDPSSRDHDGEEEVEDDESDGMAATVAKWKRLSVEVELTQRLRDRLAAKHAAAIAAQGSSEDHSIIASLRQRIAEVKRLLLLDLSSSLKQAKVIGDSNVLLDIMACFSLLGTNTSSSVGLTTG